MRPLIPITLLVTVAAAAGCDARSLLVTRTNTLYCERATDCTDVTRAICDTVAHECVAQAPGDMSACTSSKDCSADLPVCERGVCRACGSSVDDDACTLRDPATPRCATTGGRCVACRADTNANDCKSPQAPVCDAMTSMCRACRGHADCPSGACKPDGSCAPVGQVAFVDNGGRKVADCRTMGMHDGSRSAPYCDVQEAISAMGALPTVVVTGSAEAYGAVSITRGSVSLLGSSAKVGPSARIGIPSAAPALYVQGTTTVVTIDGLDVTGAGAGAPGVSCFAPAGMATLTILRSSIHDNNGVGLQSTNCNVTVDASRITTNQGGGLKLTGGTYTITNDLIATNNGTQAPAVTMDSAAMGTFAFNTVVNNTRNAAFAGIDCGSGMPRPIDHSIVWGNSQDSGSQFFGKCMLTNVVTGVDSVTGAVPLDPTFVDMKQSDFHLKAGDAANTACCVDKVDSPSSPNKDHDLDGGKRPRGARWDIGAHEVM